MKAKRISRKAVKNMIDGNTALLHIGNAVSECVYTGRLYYNKELQENCMKHILQRLTNTLSTTLILTIQQAIASI